MRNYRERMKKLAALFRKECCVKRIFIMAAVAATLPLAALDQTTRGKTIRNSVNEVKKNTRWRKSARQENRITRRPVAPLADHHTHIWSENASSLTTEPLLPTVELPEELTRLLQDKERFGGKDKNPSALADLYTKDALVLNPTSPAWLRGERAINYVVRSTVINRLLPTAYEVSGSVGYIAGYEAVVEGASTEYVSTFLYAIAKGADGKWRISSETFTLNGPPIPKALTSEHLIKDLDAAGIKRGVVLSVAYWYGSRISPTEQDEYTKVRAENDWAAEQVARYPDRLIGFCSFNPLKAYALAELDRCASSPIFKGLKLHFGMSQVDLKNHEHVRKVQQVFAAANRRRLPIIVHVRPNPTGPYGREHAEILLSQILPSAPDVPVQIAHLWGGEGFPEAVLAAYADAVSAHRPATKNLYFDVAGVELILKSQGETVRMRAVTLMRGIGLRRILWASDGPRFGDAPSRVAWAAFRAMMPLTDDEFRTIAGNVAPYLR